MATTTTTTTTDRRDRVDLVLDDGTVQLTGVPLDLSEHSLLSRLVMGVQFDLTDVLWYPVTGTVVQTTPLTAEQKAIYQALSTQPPARITTFDPT